MREVETVQPLVCENFATYPPTIDGTVHHTGRSNTVE